MSHNKIIYQNTIPPIQPDCLLPKFKIPSFSPRFPQDSSLNKFPHEFRTDSLLGVKVPLCDLSVYSNCAPENLDADDFKYYTQLDDKTKKSMLSMPKSAPPRQPQYYAQRAQQKKIQEPHETTLYLKSKNFYSQPDDLEIREQLEHAFHGNVPEGEVHLIRPQKPLTTLINRQSAKPIPKDSFILVSKGRKYLKVHDSPIEDDTPRRADKAFSIIEKDYDPSKPDKIYLFMDEQGNYHLGKLRKALILSQIAATDMKRERMIATPIIFENFQSEENRHKKSGSEQEESERGRHSSNQSSNSSSRSAVSSVSSSASSRTNSSNSENENEKVERASMSSENSEHERKVIKRSSSNSSSDSEKQPLRANSDNDRRDDNRNSSSNENRQLSHSNSDNEQREENRQSSHSNSDNEVNRQSSHSNSDNEVNRQSSHSNSENEVNRQSSHSNSENEQRDDQSQNSSRNSSSDGDNDKKSYSSSDSDKNSSSPSSAVQSSRQNSASSDSDNN